MAFTGQNIARSTRREVVALCNRANRRVNGRVRFSGTKPGSIASPATRVRLHHVSARGPLIRDLDGALAVTDCGGSCALTHVTSRGRVLAVVVYGRSVHRPAIVQLSRNPMFYGLGRFSDSVITGWKHQLAR